MSHSILFVFAAWVSVVSALITDVELMLNITSDWTCSSPTWVNSSSLCTWEGILCTNNVPTSFIWNSKSCRGTIRQYVPWPGSIEIIDLAHNSFSGNFSFYQLPYNLTSFDITDNQFIGWVWMSYFPSKLTKLKLSKNSFDGNLYFSYLPPGLQELDLSYNFFSGNIDLTTTPASLKSIRLNGNGLQGTPTLTIPAENLYILDLNDNTFCGNPIIPKCYPFTNLTRMCTDTNGGRQDPTGVAPFNCSSSTPVQINCPPCSNAPTPQKEDLDRLVMLTQFWSKKDSTWTSSTPACQWSGVVCDNTTNRVTGFKWPNAGISGQIDFSQLPAALSHFDVSGNTFNTSHIIGLYMLPENLTSLILARNQLTSQLPYLPRSLRYYDVSGNRITGYLQTKQLPSELLYLDISKNSIYGALDVTSLPTSLRTFKAALNNFSGTPDLTRLPPSLSTFDISDNNFCGNMTLVNCPDQMIFDRMCAGGIYPSTLDPKGCGTRVDFSCPPCTAPPPNSYQLDLLLNFTRDWSSKDSTWNSQRTICSWDGIVCDDNEQIIEIAFYNRLNTTGTFNARFLPPSLTRLTLETSLTGNLVLSDLPKKLIRIQLWGNKLNGPIWFEDLPQTVEHLDISYNNLCGDLDFGVLTGNIRTLYLQGNKFSGPLRNIQSLAARSKLYELYLQNNEFSGNPNLSTLPSSLSAISLGNNSFCGEITFPAATCSNVYIQMGYMCQGKTNPAQTNSSFFPCSDKASTLSCSMCGTTPPSTPCPGTRPPITPSPAPIGPSPPSGTESEGLSPGAKFGISMAVIIPVGVIAFFAYKKFGGQYKTIN